MFKKALLLLLGFIPSISYADVFQFQQITNAESRALRAASCAIEKGLSAAPKVLVVIDMARPKNEKRLKAFDLTTGKVIAQDYVAHGRGSGHEAQSFSNVPGSLATSLGLYRVAEKYHNTQFNDWRRRLDGLSKGLNDKARERAVVLHPAAYVRPGAVGRSEGCPAVRHETLQKLESFGLDDALIWIDSEHEAEKLEQSLSCESTPPARIQLASCPAHNVWGGWNG